MNVVKSPDAHPADLDSLRAQQLTFQLQIAAVAAECTARFYRPRAMHAYFLRARQYHRT